MADFKKAFVMVLKNEGGYVDDPDDRGGETYKGVARKMWPEWGGWILIDALKRRYEMMSDDGYSKFIAALPTYTELNTAIEDFYKKNFWDVLMLDQCPDQDIADEMFDTGVNQSTSTAAKYLQTSLNILNRDQADYPDITVDGIMGETTMNTLKKALSGGKRWKVGILKCMNGEQYMRYRALAIFSSKQERFMHGWLTRVEYIS